MSRTVTLLSCALILFLVGCDAGQSARTPEGRAVQTQQPGQTSPQPKSAVIWVKGLSCPLCVQAIKKELAAVEGVEQVDVNYEQESALVSLSSRKPPTRAQLVQAVERSGYVLTRLDMQ